MFVDRGTLFTGKWVMSNLWCLTTMEAEDVYRLATAAESKHSRHETAAAVTQHKRVCVC